MSFHAYLLLCNDGSYYAGHTENLDVQIAQHQSGEMGGYTAKRLPVELVWSEAFESREAALAAERQIKGWSRAKKQALIGGELGIGVRTREEPPSLGRVLRQLRLAFDRLRPNGGLGSNS